MKQIVLIIVVVLLVIGGVAYYNHRNENHVVNSGDVFVEGKPKTDAASTSAPATSAPSTLSTDSAAATTSTTTNAPSAETTAPANDTINRNPANGMIFAGTGRYQIYRQGDLTWRVNTDNGQACVLLATDNEWRKTRVYEHGCGNS